MRGFAGVCLLVCVSLSGACSSSVQSFPAVQIGPFAAAAAPDSPKPLEPTASAAAPTAACTVTMTAPAVVPAVSPPPVPRNVCEGHTPRRDEPPPGKATGCSRPMSFYFNVPAAVTPSPPSPNSDDAACDKRIADAKKIWIEDHRSTAMKLRVGFGSFFAEAADVDSLRTIHDIVLILAAVAALLVLLSLLMIGWLGRKLTAVTSMLSSMAKELKTVSSEGVEALRGLAKAFSGVAAAIFTLTLMLLLVTVVPLFWGSGHRSALTASPEASPAPVTMASDDALVLKAIDALARAAEGGHASAGSDQQLLAGLAGAGIGLVIGVLAACLFSTVQRSRPSAELELKRDVAASLSGNTEPRPLPSESSAPLTADLLQKLVGVWNRRFDGRLDALKAALNATMQAPAAKGEIQSDGLQGPPSPEWSKRVDEAAADLRRELEEVRRLTGGSVDRAAKG